MNLYNENGDFIIIIYLTTEKTISVENIKYPSIFCPLFSPGDSDRVFIVKHDDSVDPKQNKAKLSYGSTESNDYYSEKINLTVERNIV